jgi:hypothetical protein
VDYLELVNRLKLESGRSGGDIASVLTATGSDLRLVRWVSTAYEKIQRQTNDWRWMRKTVLAAITTSQMDQDPAVDMLVQPAGTDPVTDFRFFKAPNDEYAPTALDPAYPSAEWALYWLPYDTFRQMFMVATHAAGPPTRWSISPDNKMLLGPTPDKVYHVRFDYQTPVVTLAADTDEPTMPEDYHMVIVWESLKSVAGFDNAPEVYARAQAEYESVFNDLWRDQGPKLTITARPLA